MPLRNHQEGPNPPTGSWSEPNSGLSARLLVEFEDLNPGSRHAVYLELRNDAPNPIALTNQPQMDAELFDLAGISVHALALPMSGPIPSPQWAVIPRDSYTGFRVDMQTVGVPTRERGVALMAVGGKSWMLPAGEYVLKATVAFTAENDGPENQWVGELKLPPCAFNVTQEMLAVR